MAKSSPRMNLIVRASVAIVIFIITVCAVVITIAYRPAVQAEEPQKSSEEIAYESKVEYFTSDKFKTVKDVQVYFKNGENNSNVEVYEVMFEVIAPGDKIPIRETLTAKKCHYCNSEDTDDYDRIRSWNLAVGDKIRFIKVDPFHDKHKCVINGIHLLKRYSSDADDPDITNPQTCKKVPTVDGKSYLENCRREH